MQEPNKTSKKLDPIESFDPFNMEEENFQTFEFSEEDYKNAYQIAQAEQKIEEDIQEQEKLFEVVKDLDPEADNLLLNELETLKNLGKDTEYLNEVKKTKKRKEELEGKINSLQSKENAQKEYDESSGLAAIPKFLKSGFYDFADSISDMFTSSKETIEEGSWNPLTLLQADNYAGLTEEETLELYKTREKLADLRKPIVENELEKLKVLEKENQDLYDSYGERLTLLNTSGYKNMAYVDIPIKDIEDKFGIFLSDYAGKTVNEDVFKDLKEKIGVQKFQDYVSDWETRNNFIETSLKETSEKKEILKDVVSGELGFWDGLGEAVPDMATGGFHSMIRNFKLVQARNKYNKDPENANAETKALMKTIATKQEIESHGFTQDSFGYNSGAMIGNSIVQMEQFFIPGAKGVGGVAKGAMKATTKKLLTKLPLKKLQAEAFKTGVKLSSSQLKNLSRINLVEKGFIAAADVSGRALISPVTYSSAEEKYLGQVQLVEVNGEEKILANVGQRKSFENEAQTRIAEIDKEIKNLNQIQFDEEVEDNKSEIEKLELEKSQINEDLSKIYDPSGKTEKQIIQDIGAWEAGWYGYSNNLKEMASERIGGELMLKGFSKAGGLLKNTRPYSMFMKSNVARKITTPIGNTKNYLDNLIKTKSDFINDAYFKGTKLGNLSKNAMYHVGKNRLWHGFPAEVMEEIAVQLTPTYTEDYVKQLEELKNPEFYAQIMVTTGVLGGGNAVVSKGIDLYRYQTDAEYKAEVKKARDFKDRMLTAYSDIDKSIDDDALANQILMSTGGTLFDPKDYQKKIDLLRKDGKEDEAQKLEETAFINMAVKAIQSGTLSNFKKSLRRISANAGKRKFSKETVNNAVNALSMLPTLERLDAESSQYLNSGDIFGLEMNTLFAEKNEIALDKKIKEVQKEAQKELNDFLFSENKDEEVSLEDAFIKSKNDPEFKNTLDKVLKLKRTPKLQEFIKLNYTKDLAREAGVEGRNRLFQLKSDEVQEGLRKLQKERQIRAAKAKTTAENVDEVKEETEKAGNLTPEVVAGINEAAVDNGTGKEPKKPKATKEDYESAVAGTDLFGEVVKDDIETPPQDLPKDNEGQTLDSTEAQQSGGLNLKESFKDESGVLFAPVKKNLNNPSHNKIIENVAKLFRNLDAKGLFASFGDLTATMKDYHSSATIDRNFELIREAYEQVAKQRISDLEYNQTYNSLFPYGQSGVKDMGNVFGVEESNDEIAEAVPTEEIEANDESTDTKQVQYNPVTQTTEELVRKEKDDRFIGIGVKIGVLGLNYDGRADEEIETNTNEVNDNAKVYMDHRNFKQGDEVDFVFDIDYLLGAENNINVWDKVDDAKPNKRIVKTREFLMDLFGDQYTYEQITDLLREYRDTKVPNALFENTEFLKQIPVGIVNKGYDDSGRNVVGGAINSYYWFNNMNIALKVNKETGEEAHSERKFRVDANRNHNYKWRQAILNNGTFTATVSESNQDKAANKRVLKTEEEKEQGYPNKFYSLLSQFKNKIDIFRKHAGIGYIKDDFTLLGPRNNEDKETALSVDGKTITPEYIDNWEAFKDNVNKSVEKSRGVGNTGMKAGRAVYVHKSGVNDKGEQMYSIRQAVSNHKANQDSFEKVARLLNALKSDLGYSNNSGNKANSERALAIKEAFKNKFGINLSKGTYSKLRRIFPTENTKQKGQYRQDFDSYAFGSEMLGKTLPDFSKFESYNDFLKALLSDAEMPTTTREENYLNNVHTNLVFTELTKDGESVFTPDSQPFILFDSPILSKFETKEVSNTLQDNKTRLEGRKQYLENKLQETQDETAKKSLEEDVKEVEKQLKKTDKDLKVVETQEKEIESITVYHGTSEEFDKFDFDKGGSGFGAQKFGKGVYVTKSKEKADSYRRKANNLKGRKEGGQIKELKLKMSNPINAKSPLFKELREEYPNDAELTQALKDLGYDGVVYPQTKKGEDVSSYVVFDENQIEYIENKNIDNTLPYQAEIDYLENEDNKNSILGISQYDNSVREYVDQQLDLTEEDTEIRALLFNRAKEEYNKLIEDLKGKKEGETTPIDQDAIVQELVHRVMQTTFNVVRDSKVNEKDFDSASYEIDIAKSVSFQTKMMLSKIRDTRTDDAGFAGESPYLTIHEAFNALHEMLSEADNNTLEDLKVVAKEHADRNPKENKFYQDIYDRLVEVEKTNPEIVNEVLYNLYQPKLEMHMVMWKMNKNGTYVATKFNANSKDPLFIKKFKWKQNIKQSGLITTYEGDYYKVDTEKFEVATDIHNRIFEQYKDANVNQVNEEDLKRLLNLYGVRLNQKIYDELFTGENESVNNLKDIFLGNTGILKNIYRNLQTAVAEEGKENAKKLSFKSIEDKNTEMTLDVLFKGNQGRLNELAHLDNFVESDLNINTIYAGGKSIYLYQQPNSILNTIKNLKKSLRKGSGLMQDLKNSPVTSNSFLLDLYGRNSVFQDYFDVFSMSLEAIKEMGGKSQTDKSITELSDKDEFITRFGLYASTDGRIADTKLDDEQNIVLRKGSMTFPTMSDSSQLPVLKTALIELSKDNYNSETDVLSEDILNILREQLLISDLKRIGDYMIKVEDGTNIEFYDKGALWITGMPTLNLVTVKNSGGFSRAFIDVFRTEIEKIKSKETDVKKREAAVALKIAELTKTYRAELDGEIQKNISLEADKLITKDGAEGQFKDFELVDEAGNLLMDNGKKDNFFEGKTPRQVAMDYMVNYFIQQKEIQTIFFGDIPNYFKTKIGSALKHGLPQITEEDVKKYGDESLLEYVTLSTEEAQKANPEEIYAALLPVAKMKVFDMFKAVQNNLSKRLKEGISPGSQLPNSQNSPDYYQLMISDIENASKTLDYLIGLHHPEVAQDADLMDKVEEFKILDEKYDRTSEENETHKKLKKEIEKSIPKITDYLENANTDAQEYTTWQDNLDQLLAQGRIYKADYNRLKTKFEAQEKDLEENGGVIKEENRLTPEEHSMAIMQPSKPLYSGLHIEDINGHKAHRYVYIKSSSFPLTPELTEKFPDLRSLAKKMALLGKDMASQGGNQNIKVRASFGSANKSGGVSKAITLSELYDNSFEDVDLQKLKDSSVKLNPKNFYIQQDKPFKGDKNAKAGKRDETTLATQFEKIILGDGINKIPRRIFPQEMFDASLLKSLGINTEEKLNGPELKKIYNELYRRMQQIYSEDLFDSLGINTFQDISEGKPEVMEKFARVLNKRITNKQDKQALELLYVDITGKHYTKEEIQNSPEDLGIVKAVFRLPLFMSPNSRKFESVMNAIINKSNIKKKISGFSSPVGSEQGFDHRGFGEVQGEETEEEALARDYEKLKSQGLITSPNYDPKKGLQSQRYEDGTLKFAQVFVPNRFKYFDIESNTYKTVEMENYLDSKGQIAFHKFPKEILSMFSFRIPTSAHQSGAIIEVAGILPKNHADLLIVPKDHTTQIGEDYDIDVRNMYSYNLTKDGDNIKVMDYQDIKDKPEKSTTELAQEYREHLNELWNEYYKLDDNVDTTKKRVQENNLDLAKMSAIAFLEAEKTEHLSSMMIASIFGEEASEDMQKLFETKEIIKNIEDSMLNTNPENYKNFKKLLKEAYQDEKSALSKSWKTYSNAKKQKITESSVLENNLISMYKSVFQADDSEVQELITKVLSTEFSKNSANLIADSRFKPEEVYNIYSPATQREVMKLGADGKAGIGKHSTAVTFQSILQQLDEPLQFYSGIDKESGKIYRYNIKLGGLTFDGKLGKVRDNSGRRQSEYTMESQNSATDNQKLQIMGKRNENTETMGVFSLMQLTGLENDGLVVNGNEISYASLFVAQDILVDYTDLAKSFKSSTNKEFGKTEDLVYDALFEKYAKNVPVSMWATDDKGLAIIGDFSAKAKAEIGKALTGSNLLGQINSEATDYAKQWYVYQTFRTFKSLASDLRDLEQFTNIENGGLGISYFNTMELKDTFYSINGLQIAPERKENRSDDKLSTFKSLFGDMITGVSPQEIQSRKEQGYIYLEETGLGQHTMIKPENHYAHKIVNSISLGYNLWNSIFPYDNPAISEQINTILNSLQIKEGSKEELDMKYKIVSAMKDYSYTNNTQLFGNNISAVQNELFFDIKGLNQSLGSYLNQLENDKNFNYLSKKPFFKDLKVEINEETHPTTISFNSGDITPEYNTRMNNYINKLMNSDKALPDYNGKSMTESELAKHLLMYSLIADQANGATGFQKLLPMQLLEKYGVADKLRTTNNPQNTLSLNMTYNGATKAVESILGSVADDNGFIEKIDPYTADTVLFKLRKLTEAQVKYYIGDVNIEELTPEQLAQVAEHLNLQELKQVAFKANQQVGKEQFIVAEEGNGIIDTESEQGINMSAFARQFVQHNLDLVKNPIYYNFKKDDAGKDPELKVLLDENNITQKEFDENPINELRTTKHNKNYLVIIDKTKQRRLYEKQNSIQLEGGDVLNVYKRIMPLGTNGFNEYKAGEIVDQSKVGKNSFNMNAKEDRILNPKAIIDNINDVTITSILDKIQKDKNHKYNALLEIFREFIPNEENLTISVEKNVKGLASYDPDTTSIAVDEDFIKSPGTTVQEIQRAIMEEVLHNITVESVKPYGKYVMNQNGRITFEAKPGVKTPAELTTLTSIYNAAVQHYIKKYGDKKLSKLIDGFRKASNTNEAIEAFSEEDMAAYRLTNFDEFIAGIFIDDSEFKEEMQKTPYKKSGKNILERFAESLVRLFNRVLPKAKQTSISTNVFNELYNFLKENKAKGPQQKKISIQEKPNSSAFEKANKIIKEDNTEEKGNQQKLFAPFVRYNNLNETNQGVQYQNNTNQSNEDYKASEKTIRDLAERMADRIGLKVRYESDRTKDYKGKLEGDIAVINLAHATLDTPIHEILGHPIVRAIKNIGNTFEDISTYNDFMADYWDSNPGKSREEVEAYMDKNYHKKPNKLYQNLLKELETGKGKEVLDRIKRDYVVKNKQGNYTIEPLNTADGLKYEIAIPTGGKYSIPKGLSMSREFELSKSKIKTIHKTKEEAQKALDAYIKENSQKYTFEEQQEEAIVELLGLMTASKLNNTKDGKLISLLKRLLKEMKSYMKSLFNAREVNIDKLPDNMTLGDMANLLAYRNSKIILPGNEVVYTTPDNKTFKTYQEASNHISELTKLGEIDLSKIEINRGLSEEDLKKITVLKQEVKNLTKELNSRKYKREKKKKLKDLNKKLNDIFKIPIKLTTQETYLEPEDKVKYELEDFTYTRVESTYSRPEIYDQSKKYLYDEYAPYREVLGENYEGYYIHGYNTSGKRETKIIPISRKEAERLFFKNNSKEQQYPRETRRELQDLQRRIKNISEDTEIKFEIERKSFEIADIELGRTGVKGFIEKNKEYEQSKEILEEWKEVNNIQYDPEEVYSRGQGFYSVVGAYSDFDVELMFQNLLSHIEDNKKSGGEFTISAFTKPVNKTIEHLEGGGSKIKFKIFPQPKDIKWAANTDVYSGSVWDASEKVSKNSKSEVVGVSYTKSPSLGNITSIQPNLANIIDDLNHHHNELGIELTENNFRLEYDDNINYSTKKIIDNINKILDQKYGKLVEPKVDLDPKKVLVGKVPSPRGRKNIYKVLGKQPTQTNENLKSSISSIARNVNLQNNMGQYDIENLEREIEEYQLDIKIVEEKMFNVDFSGTNSWRKSSLEAELKNLKNKINNNKAIIKTYLEVEKKEYTSQAEVNTKIAALKQGQRKFPRSLIRSEVGNPKESYPGEFSGFEVDELPFQKISSIIPAVEALPELQCE